jgi:FKBP-type peptidyl-prolyl cis-trans isomerase
MSRILTPALAALAVAIAAPALAKPPPPNSASAFLARNAKAKGVTTLPGVQYRVIKSGPATGAHPSRKDDVVVKYSGHLVDGSEFDSSAKAPGGTATFPLGRLIPGWTTAVPLMRPGDEWEIVVPPEMAYGEKGVGPIPPGAVLIFDVELISVSPHVDAPPAKP